MRAWLVSCEGEREHMAVRAGREFLAIPGPTTVPDEVLRAMHRPAVDIYSGSLEQLTDSLLSDLSRLFRTRERSYIYIANGHGAWEAVNSPDTIEPSVIAESPETSLMLSKKGG